MSRSTLLRLVLIFTLLAVVLVVAQAAVARHEEPPCDLEAVIHHQNEHAQELANFAEEAEVDLDAALAKLYRTAIAYQALAAECGFAQGMAVEAAHELEHASFNTDTDSDSHTHDEAEEAEILAIAHSIGDPENGKLLFNTFQTEVSFACATCHRVDSTETLVGPGLLGIAGATHDHSVHNSAATPAPDATHDSMGGMQMGEATAEATHDTDAAHDSMGGMQMGEATAEATHDTDAAHDSMGGMQMGEATAEATHDTDAAHDSTGEATAAPERTTEEIVTYIRTSIMNPSAFVMTGFPDNLMPKVYSEIFTEQEINDLVAYLFTLR